MDTSTLISVLSIASSALVALGSIAASIYTTHVSARSAFAQKAAESLFAARLEAYTAFMSASSAFIGSRAEENLSRLHAAMHNAQLIATSDTDKAIQWYFSELQNFDPAQASEEDSQRYAASSRAVVMSMQQELRSFGRTRKNNRHHHMQNRNHRHDD